MKKNSLISGTKEERGITAWQSSENPEENATQYTQGDISLYEPLLPERIKNLPIMKYIPFLPNPKSKQTKQDVILNEEMHSLPSLWWESSFKYIKFQKTETREINSIFNAKVFNILQHWNEWRILWGLHVSEDQWQDSISYDI